MGSIWQENYRRSAKQRSVSAIDDHDLVRIEDLEALTGGSGIYRVTNLTTASPQIAPGGDEEVFDLVVIRVSGDYDVILPEDALVGKRYEIKDGAGDGCLGVTKRIVPTGLHTIEGIFTDFPLSNCYQSWSLIYAGENIWRLV